MPYLNWESSRVPHTLHSASAVGSAIPVLELELQGAQLEELVQELEAVFKLSTSDNLSQELRLKLSDPWTLFWKMREGENRILVAHPETETWVGTLALEPISAGKLISALKIMEVRQSWIITDLFSIARLSNLNLKITRVS